MLERLLVHSNGESFASFSDGSTIFISGKGSHIAEITSKDKKAIRTMKFLSSSQQTKVESILQIRNEYCDPMFLPKFCREKKQSFSSLLPITTIQWQANPKKRTIRKQEGTLQPYVPMYKISSADGNLGHLTLYTCGQLSFLIGSDFLIGRKGGRENVKNNVSSYNSIRICVYKKVSKNGRHVVYYDHIKQRKYYSMANHPSAYSDPINSLLQLTNGTNEYIGLSTIVKLPTVTIDNDDITSSGGGGYIIVIIMLMYTCMPKGTKELFCEEMWESLERFHKMNSKYSNKNSSSFCEKRYVLMDWTPSVIYRVFGGKCAQMSNVRSDSDGVGGDLPFVEVMIHHDHSYAITTANGKFLKHFLPNEPEQLVYPLNAQLLPLRPPLSTSSNSPCTNGQNLLHSSSSSYDLPAIGRHVIAILEHFRMTRVKFSQLLL
ncbi:hypothetical protein RFI_01754, partial [Reticulomyxa filosa]